LDVQHFLPSALTIVALAQPRSITSDWIAASERPADRKSSVTDFTEYLFYMFMNVQSDRFVPICESGRHLIAQLLWNFDLKIT
jgi:hypothetical protein